MYAYKAPLAPTEDIVHTGTAGEERHTYSEGYQHVLCILSGSVLARIDKEEALLCADSIIILAPYSHVHLRFESDCSYLAFIFDSPRFFDEIGIPALFQFAPFIRNDPALSAICHAVCREYAEQNAFHETMLNALIKQLLIHLYRSYPGSQNVSDADLGKQRVVRRALDHIFEHCKDGISSRDIASHANVSLSYLCRCFKEVCGVSPLEYSERVRCRKAHEDLSLGVYTVTEIAAKYHFSSLAYFNRRYKKYIGTVPSATRKQALLRHEHEKSKKIEENA